MLRYNIICYGYALFGLFKIFIRVSPYPTPTTPPHPTPLLCMSTFVYSLKIGI